METKQCPVRGAHAFSLGNQIFLKNEPISKLVDSPLVDPQIIIVIGYLAISDKDQIQSSIQNLTEDLLDTLGCVDICGTIGA